jgi:hypothetical protein
VRAMQDLGPVQMRLRPKVIYLEIMKVIMLRLFSIEPWYMKIIIIMRISHTLD